MRGNVQQSISVAGECVVVAAAAADQGGGAAGAAELALPRPRPGLLLPPRLRPPRPGPHRQGPRDQVRHRIKHFLGEV